jgi:2,4-dienoyl-CoA reductase-like NADH-dependent reductase (Old Yellow Enzyme family)
MAELFDPLTLRGTTFRNRIWISPMCQYSAETDGVPNSWHRVHLGQFAVGGAGLVLTESTAVDPTGRLSPSDTGLWNDAQAEAWTQIVRFLHQQGAAAGIQLNHGGRKSSTTPPWEGLRYVEAADGGWPTVAPSAIAFGALPVPRMLAVREIASVVDQFRRSAIRARLAGFDVVELHAAHGYLLHQFLSPLSNQRTDAYGGDFTRRIRLVVEVLDAVRSEWPDDRPVFVRLSATDWIEGGWSADDTVALASILANHGADLIDCSSGGIAPNAQIPNYPGYQVEFAARVRHETAVASGAVGLITTPQQAAAIVHDGAADAVLFGREVLRNPHWPLMAASVLGVTTAWPNQYARAQPRL